MTDDTTSVTCDEHGEIHATDEACSECAEAERRAACPHGGDAYAWCSCPMHTREREAFCRVMRSRP